MSDRSIKADEPDDATLAGEYALGLLSLEERRAVERRIDADPAFAQVVEEWSMSLQPLAEAAPAIEPPPRVWSAIAERTGVAKKSIGFWESLPFWRAATFVSSAAAAAALLLFVGIVSEQERPFVAALQATSAQPGFVAQVDSATGRVAVRLIGVPPDPARVPELWVIPADGRPRSLGVFAAARDAFLDVPPSLASFVSADATLAVSLEPPGGSTTGQPTGPVVASGRLQKI